MRDKMPPHVPVREDTPLPIMHSLHGRPLRFMSLSRAGVDRDESADMAR